MQYYFYFGSLLGPSSYLVRAQDDKFVYSLEDAFVFVVGPLG